MKRITINEQKIMNNEKWRSILGFIFLFSFFTFFASCSSDDDNNNPTPKPGSEVQFNIGFAPTSGTRVATDATFNSTFEEGDQIGIFALKAGATTNPVAQNVKLTRQANGTWVSDQKIYYPLDGSNLDFYAYYPYQGDSNTTLDNISFAVHADQSTAANYSQSDLLTASVTDQSSNLIGLSFSHLMAMVQVTTDRVSPVPTFREGTDGFKVVLKNAKGSTTGIDWTTNTSPVNTTATAEDITMYRVPTTDGSWVFRALIPSQAIATGELFEFQQARQGNVIAMGYSIATALTPAPAKAASYKVKLDYQLAADHQYAVGDVYPYKGTPVGIVYEISNGGKNGKIVSLDETTTQWATFEERNTQTDATATDNGITNMKIIKAIADWGTDYPAFAWVHAKNEATEDYSGAKGVWYLPARYELSALYAAYAANKTAFNSKLTAAGGAGLSPSDYWSSSETANSYAWIVYFLDGYTYSNLKTNGSSSVRAVSAF